MQALMQRRAIVSSLNCLTPRSRSCKLAKCNLQRWLQVVQQTGHGSAAGVSQDTPFVADESRDQQVLLQTAAFANCRVRNLQRMQIAALSYCSVCCRVIG